MLFVLLFLSKLLFKTSDISLYSSLSFISISLLELMIIYDAVVMHSSVMVEMIEPITNDESRGMNKFKYPRIKLIEREKVLTLPINIVLG